MACKVPVFQPVVRACAVLLIGAALLAPEPVLAQDAEASYRLDGMLHLEGATRWDYLAHDDAAGRLYITHVDQVEVFDTASRTVVASIPGTHGVHGVALAQKLDRGFTSNGRDNTVTIFALSSSKVLATVPTEKNPDAIVYDPASQRVFAANGGAGSITAIDAVGQRALQSIALGGRPEFAAVDGNGRLFVNLEDKNSMVVIDTAALTITHRYDLSSACDEPAGLSIDPVRQVLFVGCHNRTLVVVDANSGRIVDAVPIGSGSDATAFDAGRQVAFSSNGDGTLTVIGRAANGHYAVLQNVATMRGARTLAVDAASHAVYLVAAEVDHVDQPSAQTPRPRPMLKPDSLTLITVRPDRPLPAPKN